MSGERNSSVLFLGKAADEKCSRALSMIQQHFARVTSYLGNWGDPLPPGLAHWEGDYVISYLSRWIVPANVLESTKLAAINFHPGPPEYPGFGCVNFALYENAKEYGVTCHHMAPRVDSGPIIAVKRFALVAEDNVESVLARSHACLLELFQDIISGLIKSGELPESGEQWSRKPFSRKQLDELGVLRVDMPEAEVARRIRATNYAQWKPKLVLGPFEFELIGINGQD